MKIRRGQVVPSVFLSQLDNYRFRTAKEYPGDREILRTKKKIAFLENHWDYIPYSELQILNMSIYSWDFVNNVLDKVNKIDDVYEKFVNDKTELEKNKNFVVDNNKRKILSKIIGGIDRKNRSYFYSFNNHDRILTAVKKEKYINPYDLDAFFQIPEVERSIKEYGKQTKYKLGDHLLVKRDYIPTWRLQEIYEGKSWWSKHYYPKTGLFMVMDITENYSEYGRLYHGYVFAEDKKIECFIAEKELKEYKFTERMKNEIRRYRKEFGGK